MRELPEEESQVKGFPISTMLYILSISRFATATTLLSSPITVGPMTNVT